MTRAILLIAVLAALAGCADEQGPGNLTADEARQLDEAAEMLDRPPGNASDR